MKLVVLCLLAVCCSSLANTSTNEADNIQLRKLKEVLRHLNDVKKNLQVGSSTFIFSQLCPCMVSVIITKYDVVGLCLAAQ